MLDSFSKRIFSQIVYCQGNIERKKKKTNLNEMDKFHFSRAHYKYCVWGKCERTKCWMTIRDTQCKPYVIYHRQQQQQQHHWYTKFQKHKFEEKIRLRALERRNELITKAHSDGIAKFLYFCVIDAKFRLYFWTNLELKREDFICSTGKSINFLIFFYQKSSIYIYHHFIQWSGGVCVCMCDWMLCRLISEVVFTFRTGSGRW